MSHPTSDPASSGALERFRPPTLDDDSPQLAALDHGAVVQAPHAGEVVSYNPDAPSEEWGWHGHWIDFAPARPADVPAGPGVFGLLLLTWGNHVSHVEDYFLVIIAIIMASWIILSERANKRKRRIRP